VNHIEYDLSDSDPDDSPPHEKIARLSALAEIEPPNDDLPAGRERYFNDLKKKISKFIFFTDQEGHTLCSDNVHKKNVLLEFFVKARLPPSEVEQYIAPPNNVDLPDVVAPDE